MSDPDSSSPLFCFGTLMDETVLGIVTGLDPGTLRVERAVAFDHAQREVLEESFPILRAAPGERAAGTLVHGLDERAFERVLFFEGDEYALAPIEVRVGEEARAAVYFRDLGVYRPSGHPWSFARWRRAAGYADFLDLTARYMRLFGHMSAREADAIWSGGRDV